jgi:hypothetical protein
MLSEMMQAEVVLAESEAQPALRPFTEGMLVIQAKRGIWVLLQHGNSRVPAKIKIPRFARDDKMGTMGMRTSATLGRMFTVTN